MYYHAMRASSAAMCSTWVWAVSGPVCGLPLLFPSVSVLYVPVRFLMLDLLYMFSGRVLVVLGFQTFVDMSFKWTSRRNPELTASVWMWTNSVSTLHGVSTRYLLEMFPIETLAESRSNLWMQQSIYDMVAFLATAMFSIFKPRLKQPIDIWMQ